MSDELKCTWCSKTISGDYFRLYKNGKATLCLKCHDEKFSGSFMAERQEAPIRKSMSYEYEKPNGKRKFDL